MENAQTELWNQLNKNNTLKEVQDYINKMNEIRGFNQQEITKTMLLLTEEVGELAKAIRKSSTDIAIDINQKEHYDTIESEVADVFYVLSCVCNKLDIDMFTCLKEKEGKNIKRTWKREEV